MFPFVVEELCTEVGEVDEDGVRARVGVDMKEKDFSGGSGERDLRFGDLEFEEEAAAKIEVKKFGVVGKVRVEGVETRGSNSIAFAVGTCELGETREWGEALGC